MINVLITFQRRFQIQPFFATRSPRRICLSNLADGNGRLHLRCINEGHIHVVLIEPEHVQAVVRFESPIAFVSLIKVITGWVVG